MFKLKKKEKTISTPILCAQWKKKSFWEFAHGAKHIRKKPHGIIIIALLSVTKKNELKKDMRKTTEMDPGFNSSQRSAETLAKT
jgi:hypothetical protein